MRKERGTAHRAGLADATSVGSQSETARNDTNQRCAPGWQGSSRPLRYSGKQTELGPKHEEMLSKHMPDALQNDWPIISSSVKVTEVSREDQATVHDWKRLHRHDPGCGPDHMTLKRLSSRRKGMGDRRSYLCCSENRSVLENVLKIKKNVYVCVCVYISLKNKVL